METQMNVLEQPGPSIDGLQTHQQCGLLKEHTWALTTVPVSVSEEARGTTTKVESSDFCFFPAFLPLSHASVLLGPQGLRTPPSPGRGTHVRTAVGVLTCGGAVGRSRLASAHIAFRGGAWTRKAAGKQV